MAKKEKPPKPFTIKSKQKELDMQSLFCTKQKLDGQFDHYLKQRSAGRKVLIHLDFEDCEELIKALDTIIDEEKITNDEKNKPKARRNRKSHLRNNGSSNRRNVPKQGLQPARERLEMSEGT